MRKMIFSILLTGLMILLSVGIVTAESNVATDRIVIEDPHNATFYLHATRPVSENNGAASFSGKDFDKIMAGNDSIIGKDTAGAQIKMDKKTGCFYKKGDKDHIYHQDLKDSPHLSDVSASDEPDSYYDFMPSIGWEQGTPTDDITFVYDSAVLVRKCADVKPEKSTDKKVDYKGQVGGRGGFNLMVYEPKNPLKSAELKKLYKKAVFEKGKKPKFADFVKMHPLIYVYDGFGLYHRFFNVNFK
ncbi:hypothetical protein HZA42_03700 [Candidatus Peregrinibacteria bacterium]|nr:hypothetical protein [Candidatus Peregrinibacteria bacterium]